MTAPICIVGLGQLGSTFSNAFLALGHRVSSVRRGESVSKACESPLDLILVAVGEDDLSSVLEEVPETQRDRVALIQNELRPDQWLKSNQDALPFHPTIAIVWFEKKGDKPPHVVLPSVVHGNKSHLFNAAYKQLNLPLRTIDSPSELAHELVLKNLYILGLNLAGLRVGGVASDLLETHNDFFLSVTEEILQLEEALLQSAAARPRGTHFPHSLDHSRLRKDLTRALLADPFHACSGRSAPRRLERNLAHARKLGLSLPVLESLRS